MNPSIHQQVMGENTVMLKGITDKGNEFYWVKRNQPDVHRTLLQQLLFSFPIQTELLIAPFPTLSLSRWTVSMADSVAGGGEARQGGSMSQIVCVLPYAHDGQLPVPEPHHSAGWCAVWLATRFPAEQPHHRA